MLLNWSRVFNRTLYSHCWGSYRLNTCVHDQRLCILPVCGKMTSVRGLGSNLQIQYGGHISTLQRRCKAIVWSFCGLLICYSFWQLKPKKGTLQKKLTGNSLHSHLLEKLFFAFASERSIIIDLLVECTFTAVTLTCDTCDKCYRLWVPLRTLGKGF